MNNTSDYSIVTEYPGLRASSEQLARLYQRYRFASEYSAGKDVLEAACGCGLGLGYLSHSATRIIGGDIDMKNLCRAQNICRKTPKADICLTDAHKLPFMTASFDVILLYEAVYYLAHPELFIAEAHRVLRENGILILCTVNKDMPGFHPSPFVSKYYSVPELYRMIREVFDSADMYGAFETSKGGSLNKWISYLKRFAVVFNLIPGSLAFRAHLKRIFYGPLKPVPQQVYNDMSPYAPPIPVSPDIPTRDFQIIYCVAEKSETKKHNNK